MARMLADEPAPLASPLRAAREEFNLHRRGSPDSPRIRLWKTSPTLVAAPDGEPSEPTPEAVAA